jgi:hypothetical protein
MRKAYVTIERPDYWTTTPVQDVSTALRLVEQAVKLGLKAALELKEEDDDSPRRRSH